MLSFSSAAPILFLPFRLETRFGKSAAGAPQLWILVVPDQISVDTHEPELTQAEIDAGTAYWDGLWRLGTSATTDERPPWRVLAQAYGPQRAAWIARRLTPTNVAQRPGAATAASANPNPVPTYPALGPGDRRSSSWSRAPRGLGLPMQWTAVLYVGMTAKYTATGSLIDPRLAVGPTPNAPSVNSDSRDLQIDEGMRWTVDFTRAVDVGMGIVVDIDAADALAGFDRVFVYGLAAPPAQPAVINRSVGPSLTRGTRLDEPNDAVAELIEAHHYTDGFAFAPQGMAANNTKDTEVGYTRTDPGFDRSFRVERSGPLAAADAGRVARLLGVAAPVFSHIENGDRHEQENAKQMAVALWPATMGYVLRQLLSDDVTAEQEEEARVYFRDTVRGRGPLPAIRVGETPYGVLPITSLQDWKSSAESRATQQLVTFLRRMQPVWMRSSAKVPRVTRSGDPDQELLEVLGMDASSQSYRARHGLLDEVVINTMRFLRLGAEDEWLDDSRKPGREALDRFNYQGWDPRIIHVLLSKKSFEIPYSIVQEEALSETQGLTTYVANGISGNYIRWLRSATVDEIRDERYPVGPAPTSLLYKVLRQALLREYANSAFEIQAATGNLSMESAKEPVYIGFESRQVTTAWQVLDAPIARERTGISTKAYLYGLSAEQTAVGTPFPRLAELRAALDWLAKLPTAELERLFTETLDCFSHRLDAWITSLATTSLSERRAAGIAMTYLGGYGWVEDLRPEPTSPTVSGADLASVKDLDDSRAERVVVGASRAPVREPAKGAGGFIFASSVGQAAAAAVLRHGYLSHHGTSNGKLLALDLSSDRVRVALSFIDGVRQGQSLGALLGYRFEAGMHDRGLDVYIEGFRARFPLVANKMTQPGDAVPAVGPVEAVAAPNVPDGLALHDKWVEQKSIWGEEVPATGDDTKVEAIVRDLDDALDALGDLSAAEGVYQVLRGNFTRAGGLMDALSRGEYAPDPEILASPRSGIDMTHRVVLLATGAPQGSANWPAPAQATPRATAESRLDAWLGTMLPDPQLVRCRVTAKVGTAVQIANVTLKALELTPLDLLPLADATGEAQQSELEQRIAYAAMKTFPADPTDLTIVFGPTGLGLGPDERSFPDLLVMLRAARDLLGGARPLTPQDLIEPDRRTGATDDSIDAQELETRAAAAVGTLKDALDDLRQRRDAAKSANPASAAQLGALRQSLLTASLYGVPGAIPGSATQVADTTKPAYATVTRTLIDQATTVLGTMTQRHQAALDARAAWDMAEQRTTVRRDRATALAWIVFGKAFVLLPTFNPAPADAQAFDTARANSSALLGADPLVVARWVQQLTHVRAGMARLDHFSTTAQLAASTAPLDLAIVQLPRVNGARWVAAKPEPGDPDPAPGAVSIATCLITAYNPTRLHAGLVFDEWIERIPSPSQNAAISFYFNRPNNHAPNALLLAVAPNLAAESWTSDLVMRILNEALDLSRIRAVDLDSITEVGQVLPALYFPFNPDGQTVSVEVVEIT